MPGERGLSLPIAAISVVALFLSTTFLGPRSFDLLRLGGSDGDKRSLYTQPPVESRLWEDPFAALGRYRAKLKEICAPAGEPTLSGRQMFDPRCVRGEVDAQAFRAQFKLLPGEDLTLVAAMLPGAAFVGVEEARRRVRYAVLAGLDAEGFVPEDSEHMGLLRVRPCDDTGCGPRIEPPPSPPKVDRASAPKVDGASPPPRANVLYETFIASATPAGPTAAAPSTGAARRRAVVLWFDDAALGPYWLRSLALILKEIAPEASPDRVRLRILGPYKSDDLVKGLDDLTVLAREGNRTTEWDAVSVLANVRLISPFSTAPAEWLLPAAKPASAAACPEEQATGICARPPAPPGKAKPGAIDAAFKDRLHGVGVSMSEGGPFFVRSIGTDQDQIELLAKELCARGVAHPSGGRVVLLSEWDSIYARSFSEALQRKLRGDCPGSDSSWGKMTFESYPYLRGLDGANIDGATKEVRLVPRGDKSKDERKDAIEWPESRDQRDYVRRLVARIHDGVEWEEPKTVVRAIGMIGTDVHDKLVLAQVLREAFPDRVLFTTDLDARLMHPDAIRYMRNLVVASSLPLVFELEPQRPGIAPFRDAYQSAAFLSTRYAVAAAEDDGANRLNQELGKRHLYEIGRDGEVELNIDPLAAHELERRRGFAGVGVALLLGLLGYMRWRPTPSMKVALERKPFRLSTALLASLQLAAWGFAFGVVLELAFPGLVGLWRALVLAALLMTGFMVFRYPGGNAASPAWRAWRVVVWLPLAAIAVVAAALWLAPADGLHEPFRLLSGVSSWPAELLRTLAIVLFVFFLDHAWTRGRKDATDIGLEYQLAPPVPPPPLSVWARWQKLRQGSPELFRHAVSRHLGRRVGEISIWFWRPALAWKDRLSDDDPPDSVDGRRLWRRYGYLLGDGPRGARFLFWLLVAFGLLFVMHFLIEGQWAEVPARGIGDRELFHWTGLAAAFDTVALLVLVGDATILTFRFVWLLRDGRTVYPRATVLAFAARLGTDKAVRAAAAERVAARVEDRDDIRVVPRNTLLDDWIDAHLLADHTAAIGPLIIFPFFLVALLVISRSAVFDNFANDGAVLVILVGYLLWAIAMAALLNVGAEMARRKALASMRDDLMWLKGSGARLQPLTARFEGLIDEVEKLKRGAFAPFFEQPLVQAILTLLGSAGGIQALDLLVFARS
jgi:hypothetical protein